MLVPVCHSLRGKVIEIELSENARVEELRHALKRQTDIEVENQVLMCEWEPERGLDGRKTISAYGLPRKDAQVVFLYDKSWFKGDAAAADSDVGIPPTVDAVLPSQEQSLSSSSLAANPDGDPMQAAIISFAARFAFWKATAEAYSLAGAARSNFSEEMAKQLRMQRRAASLARASLHKYFSAVGETLQGLEEELSSAKEDLSGRFNDASFAQSLKDLEETPLHPTHCAAARVTAGTRLVIFVRNVDMVHGRLQDCHKLQATLVAQVTECRGLYAELEHGVQEEIGVGSSGEEDMISKAEALVTTIRRYLRDVDERKREFAEALEQLQARIAESPGGSVNGELMDRLQQQFSEGKDAFATLALRDASSAAGFGECRAGKEAMTLAVIRRLQRVAALQGKLLHRKKKWDALLEVSRYERKRLFGDLETVLRLPETYRAWCSEVHRRSHYFRALVAQAEAVSSSAQEWVDSEQERRVDFLSQHERLLPDSLRRLLEDGGAAAARPPRVEVDISNRPRLLPDIHLPDAALPADFPPPPAPL
eukprot:CAMPEP_0180137448 /NCGR_PEP_ID=MMETSP0986-20121125/12217_1 /TAXON_ID=697907 /ORGANISM="non described non described, Strain CCMP2293" /LENGTH=537 /DNA_ID=CAMNT_0022078909 /DNA_START=78 /DNA_END=1687 /DNA_ORIENTATION=-